MNRFTAGRVFSGSPSRHRAVVLPSLASPSAKGPEEFLSGLLEISHGAQAIGDSGVDADAAFDDTRALLGEVAVE